MSPAAKMFKDLPLAHLGGEHVGGDQLMDAPMVLVTESEGLARILLLDVRLDVNGSIDDVFHRLARDSRTASKVTS